MKRMVPLLLSGLLLVLTLSSVGCYGRTPPPQSAHFAIGRAFRIYGRKNKTSDFGKYKVTKIEILETHEIQKDRAEVEAYLFLGEGEKIYKVRSNMRKKAFGWVQESWENLVSE